MKLLIYGATRAYVSDHTAALLLDYERLLARRHTADALSLRALLHDDHGLCALRILIGANSPLRIEASDDVPREHATREPDNRMTDLFLKERIALLSSY
jgi:GAF domain-containing protein